MRMPEKMQTLTPTQSKATNFEVGDVVNLKDHDLPADVEGDTHMHIVQERKLLRKIDLWIMPLLTVSYLLQFLDKQSLNFSSVMGIIQDLDLRGTQYSWSSSVFYFGYLAFSYPASFLMVRLPLGKYLGATCVAWAVCLACHAATSSFTGLVIVRFFLGVTEASISPGFSLMTGMWYKRREQPLRHGIWFFGNSLAVMFGSLLAYGIAHIKHSIGPWRWLFIIFGIVTMAWAGVLLWYLPDTPSTARFLTESERVQAVDRIRSNQTGLKENTFVWRQAIEAMTDLKVWLLVLFMLANSIPNGAFTTFSSLVFAGFGYDRLQVYLLQIPLGAIHGVFALLSTYLCGKLPNSRCIIAATLTLVSLVGSVLVRYGPNLGSNLLGLFIFIGYVAGIPITLSMISSNVAGFTKKAVSSAMVFVAYCAGNLAGPFLFIPSEAPLYPSGFLATTICFAMAALLMGTLRVLYTCENRRRDRLQTEGGRHDQGVEAAEQLSLTNQTDKENLGFRYVL
ncbi:hypothetical protein PV10_05350 [Exophiala mesophila]|uniref:Major facilitator superfamily (MFS) profile domain-containing protein n=1 Tax=Exophiala mesophila TaxID=212818 RepID=A0A0D1Z9M6_EXOME|nr:uncharacterized protein PV10_05350 [Exophiala mesophila]KIV90724.1 hypothetical protein PV10_05350 [Exophiala mesophila]